MARRRNAPRSAAPTRTRVVAYVRVSTDRQAEEGVSLDAQRERLTAYCAACDLDLVAMVTDAGRSAASLDRPGLGEALAMLRSGRADALLVTKLDRLTRSVRDLGGLVEEHFADGRSSLISLGESVDTRTAAGRLVLHVLGAVAQWEREAIGERTSAAMRHMRAEGRYTGGREPFGFRLDGEELVAVGEEQATIARARSLRDAGASLRAVSAGLAAEGRTARSGRPFDPKSLARMLAADDHGRPADAA